jgi:hypothetical protein
VFTWSPGDTKANTPVNDILKQDVMGRRRGAKKKRSLYPLADLRSFEPPKQANM